MLPLKAQKGVRGMLLEPCCVVTETQGHPSAVLWEAGPVPDERGDLTKEVTKQSTGGASWFLLAAHGGR